MVKLAHKLHIKWKKDLYFTNYEDLIKNWKRKQAREIWWKYPSQGNIVNLMA